MKYSQRSRVVTISLASWTNGIRQGSVSTVVDLSQATYRILRHGALSDEAIAAALT